MIIISGPRVEKLTRLDFIVIIIVYITITIIIIIIIIILDRYWSIETIRFRRGAFCNG